MFILVNCSTSARRSWMICVYFEMWWATLKTFRTIFVLMFFARLAYLSVLCVSSKLMWQGDTFAIITVLQLPPNESFRRRVSLESR